MQLVDLFTKVRDAFMGAVPEIDAHEDPSDGGGQVVALRGDHKIHRLPGPDFTRRKHSFRSLVSFADWLERHAEKSEAVEILVDDGGKVLATLNGKDPRASEVSCELLEAPPYKALKALLGKPIGQREFHAFVRAYRDRILDSDILLTELRKISLKRGESFDSQIDETGRTVFRSGSESADLEGRLPAELQISTPIYAGVIAESDREKAEVLQPLGSEYTVEVLIHMDTDKGVVFMLDAPGLDLVLTEARRDLGDHLDHLLPDGFLVGHGMLVVMKCHDGPAAAGESL